MFGFEISKNKLKKPHTKRKRYANNQMSLALCASVSILKVYNIHEQVEWKLEHFHWKFDQWLSWVPRIICTSIPGWQHQYLLEAPTLKACSNGVHNECEISEKSIKKLLCITWL